MLGITTGLSADKMLACICLQIFSISDIFLPWPTISQRLFDHFLWQSIHLRVIRV